MEHCLSGQALGHWLTKRGIDASYWGRGNSKRLSDLVTELEMGESRLTDNPVQRLVSVVRVNVTQNGRTLIEQAQEFATGQTRERNQPPSEKMKRCEEVKTAVYRCLKEELGLAIEQIELDMESLRNYEMAVDSPSYPTLPTRYQIYEITAVVTGLPATSFWRDNAAHATGDPIKRHYWVWQ